MVHVLVVVNHELAVQANPNIHHQHLQPKLPIETFRALPLAFSPWKYSMQSDVALVVSMPVPVFSSRLASAEFHSVAVAHPEAFAISPKLI
jgi:hypothetical protein